MLYIFLLAFIYGIEVISMSKDIQKIIHGFEKVKLLVGNPRYSEHQVSEFERSVGYKLPDDFKTVLRAGYIDKGNFHFLTPHRFEHDETMIVFGSWNDDVFMFDTKEGNGDYPVCVTVGKADKAPEKRFNNFYEWFESVLSAVSGTNFPG
jgi:hypothetical protein